MFAWLETVRGKPRPMCNFFCLFVCLPPPSLPDCSSALRLTMSLSFPFRHTPVYWASGWEKSEKSDRVEGRERKFISQQWLNEGKPCLVCQNGWGARLSRWYKQDSDCTGKKKRPCLALMLMAVWSFFLMVSTLRQTVNDFQTWLPVLQTSDQHLCCPVLISQKFISMKLLHAEKLP